MKRIIISLLALAALLPAQISQAQDLPRFKKIVRQLSSARYQGRGYARDGVRKAGKYIYRQFEKSGVDEVSYQEFTLDINTFCGDMEISVDGKRLAPGKNFSMREFSPGVHGEFPLYFVDTLNFDAERIYADLQKPENKGCMVVCDFLYTYKHRKVFSRILKGGELPNTGVVYTWAGPLKFYKAYGEKVVDKPIIWVVPEAMEGARTIKTAIDNKFLSDYGTENVIAKVNGRRHDSCYVFTAHYDHLGNLGPKVFYPGANDNASGTATIITLADYYALHRPEFDMYFVAFSGEDANLRGSTFFVNNPVVPLEQIRFLFNIDMIGDDNPAIYCELSEKGMPKFGLFEQINKEKGYFTALDRGELAANSDHYPFAVKGVPCIFFMNEHGSAFQYYHTPDDNYRTMKSDSYEPVFKLVVEAISTRCL